MDVPLKPNRILLGKERDCEACLLVIVSALQTSFCKVMGYNCGTCVASSPLREVLLDCAALHFLTYC